MFLLQPVICMQDQTLRTVTDSSPEGDTRGRLVSKMEIFHPLESMNMSSFIKWEALDFVM